MPVASMEYFDTRVKDRLKRSFAHNNIYRADLLALRYTLMGSEPYFDRISMFLSVKLIATTQSFVSSKPFIASNEI